VTAPDLLWLTGITGHPTTEGEIYCAAVMDACSRPIIGWSIDRKQDTDLVVSALVMAVTRRGPAVNSTIPHSYHGTQHGLRYGHRGFLPGRVLGSAPCRLYITCIAF
jgi:putative transposase